MHLQRIRVPDFRVLKDVDITFEKDFVPRIFPLGSLNGGGKSTLLQLIFTLLHCSTDPERKPFLQNLIHGFKLRDDSPKRTLAIIDIWDNNQVVNLEFFSCKDSYIQELLSNDVSESIDNYSFNFSAPGKLEELNYKTSIWEEINKLGKFLRESNSTDQQNSIIQQVKLLIEQIKQKQLFFKDFIDIDEKNNIILKTKNQNEQLIEVLELADLKKSANTYNQIITFYYNLIKSMESVAEVVMEYINSKNWIFISSYKISEKEENDQNVLLCHIKGLNMSEILEKKSFLKNLSQKTFIAAPSTQVFLFIDQEKRNLLFKSKAIEDEDYYSQLKTAKSRLRNLFTYDFLAVDILIQAFKDAFEQDVTEVVETGKYGNNYHNLKNELNQMLFNKKINIDQDLSGVNFTLDRNGETIELSPEDLSHGELKRLSIYMWLKHHNIEDAIVLMDEIEIAFHPDWQYQIISDLQEWVPNNQYILATHSYELCQALTPAHVKELEPKLIKQDPEN
ncbi:AAA family ATPase [Coleofasciculus chthonoplastes]|uniref:AAA family ATPase n=1 Tax=Coleofasciculus chthonoplastes TaxID=64178 RepID=UPI0032F5C823